MVFRSPFPDIQIPDRSLVEYVFEHTPRHSNKRAIVEGPTGASVTYGDLLSAIQRTADGLVSRGLGKGTVCAIYGPNSADYAIAFYAVAMAGGVVTTINPLYNVAELTYQLRDSRATFLVSAPNLLPTVLGAAEQANLKGIFAFGEGRGATPFRLLAESAPRRPKAVIDPRRDLVALPYSSGTTGLPKGVMLTHHNIVANLVQIEAAERLRSEEIVIATLPFYHIYGMVVVMGMALHAGATMVTMPEFEVRTFLEMIQNYRITTAYLVPPMVRTLAKHPLVDRYDLSSLRHVQFGAAPLPEAIARQCSERHHCTVRQAYGLTETSSVTHLTPRDCARMNTVGVALPNTEFRVVDVATRRDVDAGDLGEVWLRGPQMMRGYQNNPEATSAMIDEDGWLHTGDIGHVDKDGYLDVAGRARELVKFRGLQYGEHELLLAMVEDVAARRQAENRLAFQALLLDSVRESVVATDVDHRVTSWNKGAEALFGYSPDQAIGRPLDELILPVGQSVRASRKSELAGLRRYGRWKGQVLRRRLDGSQLWTDLSVSTVTGQDGEPSGYVAIDRDITEQKSVEERQRFQAQLLDSVRESVIAIDLGGRVVFWGRGAEALFGYSEEEMLGQPIASFIFSDDQADSITAIRDEVLAKGEWRAQLPRRRRDGSEFVADITVAPVRDAGYAAVGLIAIHRDVTELRRNEEMLQDSRERLRNLASSLMAVREEERSAISRDLHDQLGQALTRLKIDLCWLSDQLPRYLRTKRAQSMVSLVDHTINTVQHISSRLRPAILDDLGLEAAIEYQALEFADWSRCRCRLDLHIGGLKPSSDRDTAVFRILQECLTNIARHAHAKIVRLRAQVVANELVLRVEDDGIGIPPSKLASIYSLGLIGMRERAEGVNGHLEFLPRKMRGTVVCLRVPVIQNDNRIRSQADQGLPEGAT